MKRLLDRLLGEQVCDERGVCRDTSESEQRHEQAMTEGERTLLRAERSIKEAVRQIQAAHDWDSLYGRDDNQ